jgi:hypothetical protein
MGNLLINTKEVFSHVSAAYYLSHIPLPIFHFSWLIYKLPPELQPGEIREE